MSEQNYFAELNSVNVSERTEKKNGLTYLSWAWAWGEVKKRYPDATYTIYENGFLRVGCVGCPLAGKKRYKEFARYPKFKQMYISAFDRMIEERKKRGRTNFATSCWVDGISVFHWWMEDGVIPGQIDLLED